MPKARFCKAGLRNRELRLAAIEVALRELAAEYGTWLDAAKKGEHKWGSRRGFTNYARFRAPADRRKMPLSIVTLRF